MATKKGSAALTIIIIMAVLLTIFLIFTGFVRGGFMQERALIHESIKKTGEVPCLKAPEVSLPAIILINPQQFPSDVLVPIKATINSNCFENLSITWNFDGSPFIESECAYPYTMENCSFVNYTFSNINIKDIWTSHDISIDVFGLRSGFYASAASVGFVTDPNFKFMNTVINSNNFACMKLDYTLNWTKPAAPTIEFEIKDNGRQKVAESSQIAPSKSGTIIYRAIPTGTLDKKHNLELSATVGWQTVRAQEVYNEPSRLISKEDIIAFGNPGNVTIFTQSFDPKQFKAGGYFPDTTLMDTDIAAGDLNNDGVEDEFAFLLTEGGKAELFILSYQKLLSDLQPNLEKFDIDRLKQIWPHYTLDELKKIYESDFNSPGWKAVAAGKSVKSSDKSKTGNLIVLGNPGDLDLYRYRSGFIEQVERGTDFKDFIHHGTGWDAALSDWQDIATADFDRDGEDEIIALRSYYYTDGVEYSTHDLYVFKYGDYKNVDNKAPYWHNLPEIKINGNPWFAVAAGNMDKTEYGGYDPLEIVVLGGSNKVGDLYKVQYFPVENPKENPFSLPLHKRDWPDGPIWLDVTTVDFNGDGLDELAFLYKYNNDYYVSIINYTNALKVTDFDSFTRLSMNTAKLGKADWNSISAGDFTCL
ncbi:MAG: hypothetical protein QW063_00500 [Candidatus Nanoarchaeia archaeon]